MNNKLKLLTLSLCLTLCYSSSINAMENEMEPMQIRIDRVKSCFNNNIWKLKYYIGRQICTTYR